MDDTHQRQTNRFHAALPAVVHEGGREYPCVAENLSRNGVLIVGDVPAPPQALLELTIRSTAGDLELHIRGRVARVVEEDGGQRRVGLQFDDSRPSSLDVLEVLVARVVEGRAPGALDTLSKTASSIEIRDVLAKIPVAHRVMLAQRAGQRERQFLRQDPDSGVLEGLARNPNLILPEMKMLLRRPELLPSTLDIIATDPRWRHDEEIRMLVATHPRVSFPTADRVLARMSDLERQRIANQPGLQRGVKDKLMQQLSRKHRGA